MGQKCTLSVLPEKLAVCRLPADAEIPSWVPGEGLVSLTRTREELSVIASQNRVPSAIQCEREFRAIQVVGPLGFSAVGIVASLAGSLAQADVSLLVLSTYDTDYVLVKQGDLARALAALRAAGHLVNQG